MHIAIGNLLGALLISILAPLLLPTPIEYSLVLIALCILRSEWKNLNLFAVKPWGVALLTAAGGVTVMLLTDSHPPQTHLILLVALLSAALVYLNHHSLQLGVCTLGLLLTTMIDKSTDGVIYKERSFFGLSCVTQKDDFHYYTNGNTLHGMQCTLKDHERSPVSYYHEVGPFGQFMRIFQKKMPQSSIAAVGLGVGTMAAWGQENQKFDFIEIDSLVQKIAWRHFTYTIFKRF